MQVKKYSLDFLSFLNCKILIVNIALKIMYLLKYQNAFIYQIKKNSDPE